MMKKIDVKNMQFVNRDTVSRTLFDQIVWERDTAIWQLRQLGYGFGEKIRTDGDLISRQAAIDAFCKECYDTDGEICNRDDVCGNVMILKNLPSAQPTHKDNSNTLDALDCISRQAAIYAIDAICSPESCKSFLDKGSNDCEVCQVDACMKALDALPSAQRKGKRGEWIDTNTGRECSVCGRSWEFITGIPAEVWNYNFCPNCGSYNGADMRGEDDDI